MEGNPDEQTGILIDYNIIKNIINVYDHQVVLNKDDPLVAVLSPFQTPVLTDGDPSSELIAEDIRRRLDAFAKEHKMDAKVVKLRVWESDGCYAEVYA